VSDEGQESAPRESDPQPKKKMQRRHRVPGGRPVSYLPVFSEKEDAALRARAVEEGFAPTSWIAETVVALLYGRGGLSIGDRRLIVAEVNPVLRELRRSGNNLNQLMAAVHSGQVAETPMVEATLDAHLRALAKLDRFLDQVDPGRRER
jgi:hypothetical protein